MKQTYSIYTCTTCALWGVYRIQQMSSKLPAGVQQTSSNSHVFWTPGPDLAGGRPGASWWEASAQLLHN